MRRGSGPFFREQLELFLEAVDAALAGRALDIASRLRRT